MTRTLLVATLAALLAGCAVGPTYQTPPLHVAVQPGWSATLPHEGNPADLSTWWARFNDATLTKLIEQAERTSPTLEQAAGRLRQARAAAGIANSQMLPALNASTSANRMSVADNIQTQKSRGFDASWELDLFGGNLRSVQAAAARADAAGLNWHQARVSLAAEVASTYFSIRQGEAAIALAKEDAASREKTLELVSLKVANGAAPQSEADRAEASAAEGRSALAAQVGAYERTKHQLALLTATNEVSLTLLLDEGGRLPVPTLEGFSVLPAQVLVQRPDVAAAERQLAAASANIGVATADLLPSLTLIGSIGINTTSSRGSSVSAHNWSFGPSLSLPIFDGGRRASAQESARGSYDEARGAWHQSVLAAVQEVEDSMTRLATVQSRTTDANQAVDRYTAYFNATKARFAAGATSLLELEDARRTTLAARSTQLALALEHAQARIALYKAAGGGWNATNIQFTEENNNK